MTQTRVNRKLAAVLAADVVGYSRLMSVDEAATLAALKWHREAIFDPAIVSHNGRIVKLMGDGTLAEFSSVVDAVDCALMVQRMSASRLDIKTTNHAIVLRIGINLGDVIIEGDDIYGDGVNVAARLEALAEPGGVCVSSIVYESIGTRIDARFRDGGDINVKNIDRPIRIWTWHPEDTEAAVGSKLTAAGFPLKAKKSSIAVLPFTNMSDDPGQEYFSDGISEDIITDLSKVSGLMVISRNSTFAYKGRAIDIRAVGQELGVSTVVEGSVRRAGNRVRITAQLIDAATGGHLWAERFDRDLSDLFAVQDDVAGRIVEALKITLSPTEKARITDGGTSNVDAYDFFLRGRELLLGVVKDRETFKQTIAHFNKALELDPRYSLAHVGLSVAYLYDFQNRWSVNSANSLLLAKHNVDRAIEKDTDEPLARVLAARVAMFEKDFSKAKFELNLALTLNPNSTEAHGSLGELSTFSGRPLEAIPLIERAMQLDPANTHQHLHSLGMANLIAGKYETAAVLLKQRIILVPKTDFSRALLASVFGHLGEINEARRVWRELKEINPQYSFDDHFARLPFTDNTGVQQIADGLAKAGLPN